MRTGLRFFYRHIYVTGIEHIPARGPVIIIANHPSSLMDAALLGVLLKRPLWYFTRGDVFINRPVRTLLSWLHMIPVHQYEKGRGSLNANDNSFLDARSILANNGIIVFFPESTSHTEHHLWPFRKGVFRLAFQTMADHGFSFQLPIVPVGFTYDHPRAGRQCVQVHAGPPLHMEHYTQHYQSNPSAALLRVAKDAQDRMAGHVLHVADTGRCTAAQQCLVIHRNDHRPRAAGWKIVSRTRLNEQQTICARINGADEAAFMAIEENNAAYAAVLNIHGLADKTIAGGSTFNRWKQGLLWIGFPLYIAGLALNGLPIWIARRIADKKVRRDDFYSWIFVSSCCLLYFVWLVALCAAAAFPGWPYVFILLPLAAATGWFSYHYAGWIHGLRQYKIVKRLPGETLEKIKALRAAAGRL
jgi:1-acyl-sn-glycerol-3-phosphate acyltransferase